MKKMAMLVAVTGLMLTIFGGTALALNLTGDNGPDRLVGTAENDTLRGRGGGDTLIGRGDSDRLFGGDGNDFINAVDPGRAEDDLVNCGAGFDRARVDPSTEDRVMSNCERVRVG
ncbi:calcium-binding protein [Rubrobacter tropicus]|uniref:calcium-binding protein n=1 Tax=Rubrobacter tropicus TaxID=2653851 RepID=UPI00140A3588|nr:calcium-binding protein [Rubrobacter tropicus]